MVIQKKKKLIKLIKQNKMKNLKNFISKKRKIFFFLLFQKEKLLELMNLLLMKYFIKTGNV